MTEKKVVADQAVVKVTVDHKKDGKTAKVKDRTVRGKKRFFKEHPVRVWRDYSHTVNLGNYESAKIGVGVSIPVGQEIDDELTAEIVKADEYASKFISERITKEIQELQQFLDQKKSESAF